MSDGDRRRRRALTAAAALALVDLTASVCCWAIDSRLGAVALAGWLFAPAAIAVMRRVLSHERSRPLAAAVSLGVVGGAVTVVGCLLIGTFAARAVASATLALLVLYLVCFCVAARHVPRPSGALPSISVVIPVRDDAEALARCLAALVPQLGVADELVVVDNGSSDDSAVIARAWGARVIDEPERGIAAASATGYDAARSAVIARIDADGVPGDDWLEAVRTAFDDERCDAVSGSAAFLDGPTRLRRPLAALYLGAYAGVFSLLLGHRPLFGSNCAMRASAWRAVSSEVHRHDTLVHDDVDLSYHLGRRHRVVGAALPMAISMRPFTDARAFALRLRRGAHTVFVHPGDMLVWRRWATLAR